jgi:hypothetical protein
MVVQTIAASRLMFPWLAVNPASGRITSLGIGGNRFSSATATPAPGAPSVSMIRIAHPATPPGSASTPSGTPLNHVNSECMPQRYRKSHLARADRVP